MFQRPTAAVSQLHPDRDGGDGLLPGLLSSVRPSPAQQEDEVSLEEQGEQTDIQKFWPETKLNVTYQENWIG